MRKSDRAPEPEGSTASAYGLPLKLLSPEAIKQAASASMALRPTSPSSSIKPTSLISHVIGTPSKSEGSSRRDSGSLPPLLVGGKKESSPLSPQRREVVASPFIKTEKSAKDLTRPDSLFGEEGVMRSATSWTHGGVLKRPLTASSNGLMVSDAKVMEEARKRLETIESTNENLRRLAGHGTTSPGSPHGSPLGGGKFRSRFHQHQEEEHELERSVAFDIYSDVANEDSGLVHRDCYTGSFGSRKDLLMKLEAQNKSVVRMNPEAFKADAAALTDLARVIAVEEAREKLDEANSHASHPEKVGEFKEAILGISVARPFFVPPSSEKKKPRAKVERETPTPEPIVATPNEKVWQTTLENRVSETESGSIFDTEEVRLLQFDLDWIRISQKSRFRRAVTLEDKDGPKVAYEAREAYSDELFEVYKEALLHKNQLRSIFNYYGSKDGPMDSEFMWQMTLSNWLLFCEEAGVLSNERGCKKEDLARIFAAVNYEEDDENKTSAENDANDDNKMLRFEFIEGIVRAAFGKFITTRLMDDASDAVKQFVSQEVLQRVPKLALIDPNTFREERLYVREVDDFFAIHEHLFRGCFKLYKAHSKTKYFAIEHWAAFLHSVLLIGPHVGVSRVDAKLAFMNAAGLISDELKNRKRSIGLLFYDFLEAIARLTDFISPTSLDALLQASAPAVPTEMKPKERHLGIMKGMVEIGDKPGNKFPLPFTKPGGGAPKPGATSRGPVELPSSNSSVNSDSAGFLTPKTRPLIEKLEIIFAFIFPQLKAAWGGKTEADVGDRMLQEAKNINGGREAAT